MATANGFGLGFPARRGGPSWLKDDLILDYGDWSDLSRLLQPDLLTAVTAQDDPVGSWRGQKDVLDFRQTTLLNAPKLGAAGIHFLGGGNFKSLSCARTGMTTTQPFGIWISMQRRNTTNSNGLKICVPSTFPQSSVRHQAFFEASNLGFEACDGSATLSGQTLDARHTIGVMGSGIVSPAVGWHNGGKHALTSGSTTTNVAGYAISATYSSVDAYAYRWLVTTAPVSDALAAKINAWCAEG